MGRLERELEKGTISPSDVVPGTSHRAARPGVSGAPGRRRMRRSFHKPSPAESQIKLNRLRYLRALLFEVHKKNPVLVVGLPATKHIRVVHESKDVRAPITELGEYPEKCGAMCNLRTTRRCAEVYLPESDEPFVKYIKNDPLARKATDLVVLQHELGEAVEYMRDQLIPFATHNGPEPIIREKLYSIGDPGLQAEVRSWRSSKDNQFFEKLYRQAGGTWDRPIALHSKAHRALERMLVRNVHKLSKKARAGALDAAAGGRTGDRGKYQVPYISKQAVIDHQNIASDLQKIYELRAPTPKYKSGRRPRHLSPGELRSYSAVRKRMLKKITPAMLEAVGVYSKTNLLKILIAL